METKKPGSEELANPRDGFNGLFLMLQYSGVMEWWSTGVIKVLIQFEFSALPFSDTSTLQHSNTLLPQNRS